MGHYVAKLAFHEAKLDGLAVELIDKEIQASSVTECLPEHPGGELAAQSFADKDATKAL